MATHKVTYETTDKPDPKALPTGAKVEQISPFPAVVTAHRRTLRVNRVVASDENAATIKITAEGGEAKGLPLTEAQAREIGETLIKAADIAARERVEREKAEAARKAEANRLAARRNAAYMDRLYRELRAPQYVNPFRF
ncbi:hypothetical protein DMH03_05800 [Amycolatopsis sp. WAC 01376]|uniref:hypothetical protein n=1 Tax=Amycolatopsis sp. WAC 01376 TaxID=2203195 RepID=UPI000F775EDB|nr:hypothetical protein [Amycolatopsis sp. WAC 01376]RSM66615.1 hypothetical protein DMH03_05800 [Amycolatopsis sp. WAC 01376]